MIAAGEVDRGTAEEALVAAALEAGLRGGARGAADVRLGDAGRRPVSRVPSLAEARRRAEATRRVKPDIEAPSGPAAIRALRKAINAGKIPSTYVSSGRVVAVEKVSGTPGAAAGDEDSPLPVTASEVRAPELAALLAEHTNTYRIRTRKTESGSTETYEEEITPQTAVLNAALAPKEWPDLRPLLGIVGAPVLRPDGTLLQQPGYDPATCLYLASKVPLEPVRRPWPRLKKPAGSTIGWPRITPRAQ